MAILPKVLDATHTAGGSFRLCLYPQSPMMVEWLSIDGSTGTADFSSIQLGMRELLVSPDASPSKHLNQQMKRPLKLGEHVTVAGKMTTTGCLHVWVQGRREVSDCYESAGKGWGGTLLEREASGPGDYTIHVDLQHRFRPHILCFQGDLQAHRVKEITFDQKPVLSSTAGVLLGGHTLKFDDYEMPLRSRITVRGTLGGDGHVRLLIRGDKP